MVWAVGLPLDTTKVRLIPGIIRANNLALETVVSASSLAGPTAYIPTTHPVYFYSDTIPTGWLAFLAPADCLLALKGGASQYNVAGGAVVGTWSGPNFTLTHSELPDTGGGPVQFILTFASGASAVNPHSHDWTTTRPYAALGVLATKLP